MASWLTDKHVLVTGGAGAFGQNFLRRAQDWRPASVTIFSRDEMKHAALRREWAGADWLQPVIGDILRPDELSLAMSGVDVVIHAAAMKHVSECELHPGASTRVNVEGTRNVVDAFLRSTADTLVFLSTDKAPYASSVYGMQKFIGEKIVAEANRRPGKRAYALRYSNVMDSTGTVFHVFRQLLSQGSAITVNGAETKRGFVSQTQVLDCLEQTLYIARGGEVFVLIPQIVKIAELAEAMREIFGKGEVCVKEAKSYFGEKESATLVMAEEKEAMREFPEIGAGNGFVLDMLHRHPQRPLAQSDPKHPLTLADCPALSGAPLVAFVQDLLRAQPR
jgi:UDP-glucose 4-epimerase